jgi:hypothetical protein
MNNILFPLSETDTDRDVPAEQAETLRRFASHLLHNTVDNPQAVIDLLNHHFWELV